jgi:flagellar motor component MotA
MKKTYFLSIALTLGVFALGVIMAGTTLTTFANIPCLIVVTVPGLLMLLAGFTPAEIGRGFRTAFRPGELAEKDLRNGVLVFRTLQRYIVLSGAAAFMIGIIVVLATLEDPAKIGVGLAIALTSLFYSLLLMVLVTTPFAAAIEKALNERLTARSER